MKELVRYSCSAEAKFAREPSKEQQQAIKRAFLMVHSRSGLPTPDLTFEGKTITFRNIIIDAHSPEEANKGAVAVAESHLVAALTIDIGIGVPKMRARGIPWER